MRQSALACLLVAAAVLMLLVVVSRWLCCGGKFVLPHASLRSPLSELDAPPDTGALKRWQPRRPAMAAGLTERVWSLREVLMERVPRGCNNKSMKNLAISGGRSDICAEHNLLAKSAY